MKQNIVVKALKIPRFLKFTKTVLRNFFKDKCLTRASSLSYSTLLAIVPLSAFVFALFTAFGAFDNLKRELQEFIVNMLIPTMHQDILKYLNTFINNSRTLGIAGLSIFAVTSVLLLDSINGNFNSVWGSTRKRNFISKLMAYTSLIVFGTLFIGTSFAISGPIHRKLMDMGGTVFIVRWLMQLLPSILIFLTFLLMILAIPAGKVLLKSAVPGAFLGTVMWSLARWFFLYGTNYVLHMSLIYGSIAAIPIFLFWMFIIWIIIFLALEITYVHQHYKEEYFQSTSAISPLLSNVVKGIEIILSITTNFYKGKEPYSVSKLAYLHSITIDQCMIYLRAFSSKKILNVSPDKRMVLPLIDPGSIAVTSIMEALLGTPEAEKELTSDSGRIILRFLESGYEAIRNKKIRDLLL